MTTSGLNCCPVTHFWSYVEALVVKKLFQHPFLKKKQKKTKKKAKNGYTTATNQDETYVSEQKFRHD